MLLEHLNIRQFLFRFSDCFSKNSDLKPNITLLIAQRKSKMRVLTRLGNFLRVSISQDLASGQGTGWPLRNWYLGDGQGTGWPLRNWYLGDGQGTGWPLRNRYLGPFEEWFQGAIRRNKNDFIRIKTRVSPEFRRTKTRVSP